MIATIQTSGHGVAEITSPAGAVTLQGPAALAVAGGAQVPAEMGQDGREIELRATVSHIQWRYVGATDWTNLIALSALSGPPGSDGEDGQDGEDGADGRAVEMRSSGTHIEWRYVGDTSWTQIVALSEITGPAGANGTNGTNGTNGASAFVYIRYASDTSGAGFSATPSDSLPFIGVKTTTTAIVSPSASDFTGLWVRYIPDSLDASAITFSPGAHADWNAEEDPGNVDGALNQLAERVKDIEGSSGGGGAITGTGIAYVRGDGDDATGTIGDPSKPFATGTAAWLDGARSFEFGSGSHTINAETDADADESVAVFVRGTGHEDCSLALNWSAADGEDGADAPNDSFPVHGGDGQSGKTPALLLLQSDHSVAVAVAISGGDGGDGGNGNDSSGEFNLGGNGGNGGVGGNIASFELRSVYLASLSLAAGLGGSRGIGGVGPLGAGVDGSDGAGGSSGFVVLPRASFVFDASGDLVSDWYREGVIGADGDLIAGAYPIRSTLANHAGRLTTLEGSASPVSVLATTSDFTDSTGAVSDVPGMAFSVAANEKVTAILCGFWETSGNNYGSRIAFTGPASPTSVTYGIWQFTSANAARTISAATAFGAELFETNGSAGLLIPFVVVLHLTNGSNAGTVQFRAGGESNLATFKLARGFTLQIMRIP